MQKKRGQLTLFVIIGIVLFFIIFITLIFVKTDLRTNLFTSSQNKMKIENLEYQIEDCLEQRLNDAISLVGLGGGYIEQKDIISSSFGEVSYAYKKNKNLLPTINKIEESIANYLSESVPLCIELTENLEIQENIKTNVKVERDVVKVNINIPFYLYENEKVIKKNKNYFSEATIRLGKIHYVAQQIIEKQRNYEGVPLTFIASDEEHDIYYDFYDEKTVIYIIHDEESKLNGEISYNFIFAVEII
jgi:hypothetical protein